MDIIQTKISPLVTSQFPALYRDEGPKFVQFVKKYIEWLESENNPLYYNRNFLNFTDIDDTIDNFLVHFKDTYLKGIKLDSTVKTKQLTKHSLDLYRSKGTERGIDLLLRAEYGVSADIYFPSTDLFKPSSGKWVIPKYLEVSLNEGLSALVEKEISGKTSGATAFVERAVRISKDRKLIDLLYISSINGTFVTGEVIDVVVGNTAFEDGELPVIVGSLSNIDLDTSGTGEGFSIGDKVEIYSDNGFGAVAKVLSTKDVSGLIEFELINGGYGYSNTTEVIISEKYLKLANVKVTNTESNTYFNLFDSLVQPTYMLNYLSSNGTFVVGDDIYSYHPNNNIMAHAIVTNVSASNTTAGTLTVDLYSGAFSSLAIYNSGNTIGANLEVVNGAFDSTTTGNVIGIASNVVLNIDHYTNAYSIGDRLYQLDVHGNEIANGVVQKFLVGSGTKAAVTISNVAGLFTQTNTLYSNNHANSTSVLIDQEIDIGVFDITNNFYYPKYNYVYSPTINGTCTFISMGEGASVNVSIDHMTYTEDLYIVSDVLSDYANIVLNVSTWTSNATHFIDAPAGANAGTSMNECFNNQAKTYGKQTLLVGINPGQNYNSPLFVLVYDDSSYRLRVRDAILTLDSNTSAAFEVGEVITQEDSGARGLLTSLDDNVMYLETLRVMRENRFVPTINSSTIIVGTQSGAEANVTLVSENLTKPFVGTNALLLSTIVNGNGAVTGLEIVDSGFNFREAETVYFHSIGNNFTIGSGIARVRTSGKSEGFYVDRNGFASDRNKLRDGYYYQEYSYDIMSSLELSVYEKTLRNIMHVAGTKYFGTTVHNSKVNSNRYTINTVEIDAG